LENPTQTSKQQEQGQNIKHNHPQKQVLSMQPRRIYLPIKRKSKHRRIPDWVLDGPSAINTGWAMFSNLRPTRKS